MAGVIKVLGMGIAKAGQGGLAIAKFAGKNGAEAVGILGKNGFSAVKFAAREGGHVIGSIHMPDLGAGDEKKHKRRWLSANMTDAFETEMAQDASDDEKIDPLEPFRKHIMSGEPTDLLDRIFIKSQKHISV